VKQSHIWAAWKMVLRVAPLIIAMIMQPPNVGKARLVDLRSFGFLGRRVWFLMVRVWGLLVFKGLLGFFPFVDYFGCSCIYFMSSCVLRGVLRFFNKTFITYLKKKKMVLRPHELLIAKPAIWSFSYFSKNSLTCWSDREENSKQVPMTFLRMLKSHRDTFTNCSPK